MKNMDISTGTTEDGIQRFSKLIMGRFMYKNDGLRSAFLY